MTNPPHGKNRRSFCLTIVFGLFTAGGLFGGSVVVFNELHYNPDGESEEGEWLELYNQMGINVDLSDWRLGNGVEFTFPEGTVVPPGGYLIIAKDPSNPALAEVETVLGPYEGFLSNGGERIDLLSSADRQMDRIDYDDSGEWPVAADGGGVTLAKRDPKLPSGKSLYWGASLQRGGTPGALNFGSSSEPVQHPLVLNEVSGADDRLFFIELKNVSTDPIDTDGYVLAIEGNEPASIALAPVTLPPGEVLTLTELQLGQRPLDDDKLFLRTPGGEGVADARRVTNRLRGRSSVFPGRWVFPSAATPGEDNVFDFESNIVINEICYHAPLLSSSPGVPPTIDTVNLIGANATWRFLQAGDDLGANWAAVSHPVGNNWESGAAIIGAAADFPFPIGTQVDPPQSNNPFVTTYYFESDFELTAELASKLETLKLVHLIDDGAVFYLNGVELHRFNMPDGPISASTLAGPDEIGAANYINVDVTVPPGTALPGSNRLSVEVHQRTLDSEDVIFGLAASAEFLLDPGEPARMHGPSDEQWLELYNRGAESVDLSGWDFGEGIDFTFPAGTILDSGEYIVVSHDPAALLAKHAGVNVVGPYSGSLSRGGETLILRDAANNPADIVRYVDGGSWPSEPDGQGSTLELRDPDADNSLPGAWAASDELARTGWQTYRYRGRAAASAVGPDGQWHEFVLGMLEEGEVLLDDISVVEDPRGAATQFVSDGNFERGDLGTWRAVGNHRHVSIVPDPDDPGNNVLHLRATGSTEHMHNHLQTTLANGERTQNGQTYEITFRARWLKGCNLLHTRLYFNRLPMTTELERSEIIGTPGGPNSVAESNSGPTSWGLRHSPVVPARGEPTTVSVKVSDPDGIGVLTLFYSAAGGSFRETEMSAVGDGTTYEGAIPGLNIGQTVRFYVEARDALGAISFIPEDGPNSGAMYQVDDGRAATTGIHNFRIVMTPEDIDWMYTPRNVMSNDRLPCTVIYRESEIYYNAGVRIKGSQRARVFQPRTGFNVAFPKDNLFRGVHRTVAIDRSEGTGTGIRDFLFDLAATGSGGVPAEFNDLCYVVSPKPEHTDPAILQMARYNSVFLDEQFENGSDGTVYEYELIYYPTTADAEGYKLPQPDSVVGTQIRSLGDNKESYRWNYLIKNNQEFDDFSGMIRMCKQFDLTGARFEQTVDEVLDVDQWLRALGYSCAAGAQDAFFNNAQHNGQFYARPDGRILYFPHDLDAFFQPNMSIFQNRELGKLTRDDSRKRDYLGHLHDICTSTFNQNWMRRWTTHLDALMPGPPQLTDDLAYINQRSTSILSQINSQVSPLAFGITTNGGANFSTSDTPVTIEGTGWVDVREIRLAGSSTPLPTEWTSLEDWSVAVPVTPGPNTLTFEAVDFGGEVIATDTIVVTSTAATNLPSAETLVVSEIYYNPPGSEESTEYLELLNIDPSVTLDLTGLSLAGVSFTFPAGSELAPGARVLLVSNQAAFEAQFGANLPVGGTFSGNLENSGEALTLSLADGTPVQSFAYNDKAPWPSAADGDGFSLVLNAPFDAPDHSLATSWRASSVLGGSPGETDTLDYGAWKSAFGNPDDFADPDGDQLSVIHEFYYGGSPAFRDTLGPVYDFQSDGVTLIATVPRRAAADARVMIETSKDLENWIPGTAVTLLSNERVPDSSPAIDLLRFQVTLDGPSGFYRFVFSP